MSTAVYPTAAAIVAKTEAASFIPEIWSDEIRASYENSLVIAPKVKKISMTGKKGDKINIPAPIRGAAAVKAADTQVTIQSNVEGTVGVDVDKHYEYSRFIEDIVEVQALSSLRKFYTEDAGYALAKQIDTDLLDLAKSLGNGDGSSYVNTGSFYTEAGTGVLKAYAADTIVPADVFVDGSFRNLIQKMDDADVPMTDRCFVIPPSLRNAIMGIDRYQSSDFTNAQGVQNGKIGELYGIDVMVSTNCPIIETAAQNGATAGGRIRSAQLLHKDTYVLAEQQAIRSQTQYKQEFLSTLYTADTLYGVKVLRPDAGFSLAVNG